VVFRVLAAILAAAPGWLSARQPPEAAPAVRVAFTGDVTLGHHFEEYFRERVASGASRAEMLDYPFRNVRGILAAADVAVINLECPFTEETDSIEKAFAFRASPELADILPRAGIDVAVLANNHAMDHGWPGLADTLAALAGRGVAAFGAGADLAAARSGTVVERGGIRIGLLGYLYLGPRPIEPPVLWATDGTPGVAGVVGATERMAAMVKGDVGRMRRRADVVVVTFHWGREGHHRPTPYQRTLAHAAVDAGARLVVGHHPHVLQGVEIYRGAPIAYSLGNLVFGGNWNPRDKDAAILVVTLTGEGARGIDLVPLRSDGLPGFPFQPVLLRGDEGLAVLRSIAGYSKGLGRLPSALAHPHVLQ
jgi:poly-gamma-glutamate synthesis protein (capsule biosynthesis protein)